VQERLKIMYAKFQVWEDDSNDCSFAEGEDSWLALISRHFIAIK
jgi:hypothetical protein